MGRDMHEELIGQALAALAQFSSTTRLYELTVGDGKRDLGSGGLLVEAFAADDMVHGVGVRDVIAVSTSAYVDMGSLLGQPAALLISLADGMRERFAGDISEVDMLGSEGGLARYRVRISPWIWRLGQVYNSRVWQDKSVIDIVDDVLGDYAPLARWRWSDDAMPFMADAVECSYCCQYRETDLAFVERLLTEEGLAWRFEQAEDGPTMVLFADSKALSAVPEDPSSALDGGIRYHAARSGERQDTVQAIKSERSMGATMCSVIAYDYKAKKVIVGTSPSLWSNGPRVPALEDYDAPGQYAYTNAAQARRYADIKMEGREARSQKWTGRSTVRTLRAGTRLGITGTPLSRLGATPSFTILRVASVGVNNLPGKAAHALAELFGPIPELLDELVRFDAPDDFALAIAQAQESGYGNCFEAVASEMIWRPQTKGHPRATASGAQSAIVVGPDGADSPNGADELYCDRLGRVRIRFHWQKRGDATCWVRVAQRLAGGGIGFQFLPRIGQEVAVQFIEGDIDRPVIVGALYNGRGEGGVPPTPGGERKENAAPELFKPAHDHAVSGQGNLRGGHSPVWHGASSSYEGHRNAAAMWGVRSKEFGGSGYNQLLFDDTDEQGRVQLRTTHAATELNLGHLIHSADNFRGSLRGNGAELRTDDYGAVWAGAGLLVSSYRIGHSAASRDPAGDNSAGIAMLKQAVKVGETFSQAAVTHETVGLAAHLGAGKANASALDDKAAPLKAMLGAVSGMVDGDGGDEGKLPHVSAPVIAVSAKSGLGVTAGQSVQLSNGETTTVMSGQDTQFVTGAQMRVHSGQAIGVLAGAVKPGEGGIGLQMIAAKDAIDVQAQADVLKVQARDMVNVMSANAHIDWAAAKRISISTAGGANITIENGNITVQCPGKITVHARQKSFLGPERLPYPMPAIPRSICIACLKNSRALGPAFTLVE